MIVFPPPPDATALLLYYSGATEPSLAWIPRRLPSGESLPPLCMTGKQYRLMQILQRSGSRFV